MENIWTAVIIALVTSTLSPALLLWMKNKSDRHQRIEDAEFKRQERLATEAREDAREARAQAQRAAMVAGLEIVKKQTDGVIAQVTALATSTGRIEGEQAASVKALDTASTLALGQQQGRDAERESIAAKTIVTDSQTPLPVSDDRTALASERVAEATERSADAAQRVASVAEEKKGD